MEEMNKATVDAFKEEKKEAMMGEYSPNPEEIEAAKQIYAEAQMPLELKDGDVVCGKGEIDIRELSRKDRDQMIYRALMLTVVYLRQVVQGQTDAVRMDASILRALGVKGIAKHLEETVEAMAAELDEGKVG